MKRRFATTVAAIGVGLMLAGCAPAGLPGQSASPALDPSASETPPATASPSSGLGPVDMIEVVCDENLDLTVSASAVRAIANGVPINAMAVVPGIYLHHPLGTDELSTEPTTWVIPFPPGDVTLSCSTPESEGPALTVEVMDPGDYWSGAPYTDYGCPTSGIPDWAIDDGSGETPEEAVAALARNHNDVPGDPALTRWEQAAVGYADDYIEYWLLGTDDETVVTAMVFADDAGYRAKPDLLCDPHPWSDPA